MAIKYSKNQSCWCVHSTQHTNLFDVVDWCANQWGRQRIDGQQEGTWSWSHGYYYGFTSEHFGFTFDDRLIYFSFSAEEDAVFFAMRWA